MLSTLDLAVAPLLLTPRLLQSATQSRNAPALASSSALALGHGYMPPIRFPAGVLNRRTTSTSLRILEVAPSLLSIPVPDAEPASSGNVSLLRGFQATVPSADTGKERRRKVRGSLADSGIGGSVGVKKIAAKEGVVDGTAEDEEEGEILNPKERRRRRRETAAHNHGTKGRDIGAEELARMQDEIKWDRENLVVRKVRAEASRRSSAGAARS
jgi:division protein 1